MSELEEFQTTTFNDTAAGFSSGLPLKLAKRTVPTIRISPFLKTQEKMHRFSRNDVKDALIFFRNIKQKLYKV